MDLTWMWNSARLKRNIRDSIHIWEEYRDNDEEHENDTLEEIVRNTDFLPELLSGSSITKDSPQ